MHGVTERELKRITILEKYEQGTAAKPDSTETLIW